MTEQARGTPEPLTPESIEQWREQVAHRTVDPNLPWKDSEVIALVARFLATIDALRAATPDPAEPGLRERIEAVVRDAQFPKHYSLDENAGSHAAFLLGAQEIQAVILRDLRAALSDTTEGQS
jgi:hypothetical protein